ncbi:Daunorubicin/doxorubicin resistance ATP-binding protein DrrA [compost metagenome]
MTTPDWAIQADDLALSFGPLQALDGISLSVRPGEVFGVLGPNGAGKTTTVRVLNGLIKPDRGHTRVWGLDSLTQGDAVRRHTGVLTESPSLYEAMTGRANLRFFGTLHGLSGARLDERVTAALEAVGLVERAHDKAGTYSKGMKQRLAIARAILHDPPVLFLDEPTSGLDPESANQVNALIRRLAEAGRTVYLCTHLLNEAERLCRRFALFHRGRVLATGTKADLEAQVGSQAGVRLVFAGSAPALQALPGERDRTLDGEALTLRLDAPERIPEVVAAVVAAGGRLMQVEPLTATLEELYFALMRRQEGIPR